MKITKIIAIGLFVIAMILNVSVYVDSGNSQKADLSIGDLQISLFEKAYAGEGGCSAVGCFLSSGDSCPGHSGCYWEDGSPY